MESKEAIARLKGNILSDPFDRSNDVNLNELRIVGSQMQNEYLEELKTIEKDLEQKEKQDKILERLKRPLLFSERKKLGEEYIEWAKENNVIQNNLTSIITWCFCFKMKEWLEDDCKRNN